MIEDEKIEKQLNKEIYFVLASDETIQAGFEIIRNASQLKINQEKNIEKICVPEQVIIIRNYAARLGLREEEVIMQMGLVVNENS